MRWFRLHHSILDSLTVRLLQPSAQLDYFWLLCLASEYRAKTRSADHADPGNGDTGLTLPACAWRARSETLVANGQALLDAGLIAIDTTEGTVALTDWARYQRAVDDNRQRQSEYRARQKIKELEPSYVTSDVTLPSPVKPERERERESREVLQDQSQKTGPRSNRGTRLQTDWRLPDEWKSLAIALRPDWTPQGVVRESITFRDYWLAKTGQSATKADWLATWRNWIRRAEKEPAR